VTNEVTIEKPQARIRVKLQINDLVDEVRDAMEIVAERQMWDIEDDLREFENEFDDLRKDLKGEATMTRPDDAVD
jgi:hypothetical protein